MRCLLRATQGSDGGPGPVSAKGFHISAGVEPGAELALGLVPGSFRWARLEAEGQVPGGCHMVGEVTVASTAVSRKVALLRRRPGSVVEGPGASVL